MEPVPLVDATASPKQSRSKSCSVFRERQASRGPRDGETKECLLQQRPETTQTVDDLFARHSTSQLRPASLLVVDNTCRQTELRGVCRSQALRTGEPGPGQGVSGIFPQKATTGWESLAPHPRSTVPRDHGFRGVCLSAIGSRFARWGDIGADHLVALVRPSEWFGLRGRNSPFGSEQACAD